MVHQIPVFPLPTAVTELGDDPERQAETLRGEALPAPDGQYLEDTSTYWWRSELALELASAWSITGLEFLSEVVALLSPARAHTAARATEEVLARLEAQAALPTLRHAFGPELEAVACANIGAICRGEAGVAR